ncbi:hypothetical protein NUACC21_17040 [Scytonema sp. NUACC21]
MIGVNNSPEIASKINYNRFYTDSTLIGLPLNIIGGTGKQTNCQRDTDDRYPVATTGYDTVDMSNAQEACICSFATGKGRQVDELIGSKYGKNTFVLPNFSRTFFGLYGDGDYV